MRNKHRIILALMASLGLITFGAKNANAKSNVRPSNQSLIHQTKVVNKSNNDSNHLPKNLSQSQVKHALFNVHKSLTNVAQSDYRTGATKVSESKPAKVTKKIDHSSSSDESAKSTSVLHSSHEEIDNSKSNKSTAHKLTKKNSVDKSDTKIKSDYHSGKDHHLTANLAHHKGHVNYRLDIKHGHHEHSGIKHSNAGHHHSIHIDNNEQNIGGMNQFTSFRHHYLYHQIGGNTRDLGGYPADHGKYQIASDRIIRSADLDGLSHVGIKTLKHLHVNKVIDLRYYPGKDGIQGHPDPSELRSEKLKGTRIDYQVDPVYTHTEAHQLGKYMKTHNEHGEYYFYGDLSVSKPQAIKTYRKIFSDLLNNHNGAVLFHCNLGRDRTGVTSALILSALGVSRNVIYHDYLLTYRYHYHFSANNPAYAKHAAELQYFFKTIDSKYGNVKSYLSNEIGLNHSKLMKLRKMYLVPNN